MPKPEPEPFQPFRPFDRFRPGRTPEPEPEPEPETAARGRIIGATYRA